MRWATYFAVLASVLSVGLALGVSMPLVSLRLEGWGYGSFAIGVMAAMPAIGVLLGAKISSHLAARFGTANLMRLCLWAGALSIGLLALLPSYPVWLVLRLMIGVILTIVFILGESWINQLVVENWRGRLVALYGSSYALSQLSGPLLLGALGTEHDYGFWVGVGLLTVSPFLLMGRSGAPSSEASSVTFGDLWGFARELPAIAWAVSLFAAFEAMILTLLPVYCLQQGFSAEIALAMVSTVVVGDALLQLPIGALADYLSRRTLFTGCAVVLMLSSLAIPHADRHAADLAIVGAVRCQRRWVVHFVADPDRRALSRRCAGAGQCAHCAAVGCRLSDRAVDGGGGQSVDQRACVAVVDGGGGVWAGDSADAPRCVWHRV